MPPTSDLEYWNRRESAGAILANLRWTWSQIRAHAGWAVFCLIVIHILLGIQPALLIYVTRHLVDAVVDAAGGGPSGFDDILPWLIAFGLIQLAANDVMWHLRDVFHLRLEQNLSHVLGRRLLERSSRMPLLFFDVSETYDRLERARDPGANPDDSSSTLYTSPRPQSRPSRWQPCSRRSPYGSRLPCWERWRRLSAWNYDRAGCSCRSRTARRRRSAVPVT